MFNRRCRAYEAIGYKILLPASASSGWPASIPLPVDPKWKSDYATTVKRLIHDGVDIPLATLFRQVAVNPLPTLRKISAAHEVQLKLFFITVLKLYLKLLDYFV